MPCSGCSALHGVNPNYKKRQGSNGCKRVLEAAKFSYGNKKKTVHHFEETWLRDFRQIASSVLNKHKSAIHSLFNNLEVLSSASDKAKLFAKSFSKNSKFDDLDASLLVFPSRTNLKLLIFFCNFQNG